MKPSLPVTQVFPFSNVEVRTRLDQDGDPWFCAKDVCEAIGISNSRDAIDKLDDDEKGVGISDTLGGPQQVTFVSESGLYTLLLRSQDAVTPGTVAHRFRKWVTTEVLPQLRRQGFYGQHKVSERLQVIKASAALMRRMVETQDQCEVAHLMELNADLCRMTGTKVPDMNLLGYRRTPAQVHQLSLVPKTDPEPPGKE